MSQPGVGEALWNFQTSSQRMAFLYFQGYDSREFWQSERTENKDAANTMIGIGITPPWRPLSL